MSNETNDILSRRRALLRLSALAIGAYVAPAFTTLSTAAASSGGEGGSGGEGSSGGESSGSSTPSEASAPSEASTPSTTDAEDEACTSDSAEGCTDSTDDETTG